MLRLMLFGAPRVERGGQPVPLRRSKALALLAYLARAARPQEREQLSGLLWPEFDPADARNNLRRELSLLKSALGEALIDADRLRVAWGAAADCAVDAAEFEARLAAHAAHGHRPGELCAQCAVHLGAAAALYSDDLLAGFSLPASPAFEEWLFFQREELRRRLDAALAALAAWHGRQGEGEAAISYARRRLSLDPLHEPARRELMRLCAEAGQRALALRVYEEGARLLEAELGAEPEPETTALYETIRARRPAPAATVAMPAPAAPPAASPPAAPRPAPHSLPPPRASFVGRQAELAAIRAQLADPACRLLTLVGPGGIGKTQLALQAARSLAEGGGGRWPDGIRFVPMATISDPELALPTIARALEIPDQRGRPPLELLAAALGGKRLLLLLDNLEQVIVAAPQIAALLEALPLLSLLVTSREALRVQGEREHPVPPLALPAAIETPSPAEAAGAEAVQLFVERARMVRPDFVLTEANAAAVVAICRHLDGLPLAIELAAARVRLLPPAALFERLELRLPLLTGGERDRVARHRTLRDALAWSYNLLGDEEQRLFRQLAVFVGGASLAAVEALWEAGQQATACLDLVESLVAKSLLLQEAPDGEPRVRMLATIREYAAELLAADGEAAGAQARHSAYYLALAEEAGPQLRGPDQQRWHRLLALDHDNFRAALVRAQQQGDASVALRLAAALWRFWYVRGYLREGRRRLEECLALADDGGEATAVARVEVLNAAGGMAWLQAEYEAAQAYHEQSMALSRSLSRRGGEAASLHNLGLVARAQGDFGRARAMYEASLAIKRELDDRKSMVTTLNSVGLLAAQEGDDGAARAFFGESLAIAREFGDLHHAAMALNNLGEIARRQQEYRAAKELFEECAAIARSLDNLALLAASRHSLGWVALGQGAVGEAHRLFHEAVELQQRIGGEAALIEAIEGLACALAAGGGALRATRLFGAADALRKQHQSAMPPSDYVLLLPYIQALRSQLEAGPFAAAWAAGEQLSLAEAPALALEGQGGPPGGTGVADRSPVSTLASMR